MLNEYEKALLFDSLQKHAKWRSVGDHTGYWEIHIWSANGDEFDQAMINFYNTPKDAPDEDFPF